LLLIFFINAALSHGRHISLAGLFLAPLLAELLGPWSPRISIFFDRGNSSQKQLNLSPLTGPLATVVLAASLFSVGYANHARQLGPVIFPLPDKFPAQAVRYLKKNPPAGKMFNEYFIGGYLIYTLSPAQKVFIDGRADMYGEEIFKDYRKIAHLDEETGKLLGKYEIDWIIYPVDKPLVRYLKATENWSETYRDERVVVLERHNSES
ncbi:MAG: hypothetical protein P1P81_05055, partial [Desulfobulbales bacterium]|nr:hypothetical protein [Desulfobulbales bacterium]